MKKHAKTHGTAPAEKQMATAIPEIAQFPVLLDTAQLRKHFGISRTPAYKLATAGEITSLTVGAPGKHGKRVFLTESVWAYIARRAADAKPLNCKAGRQATFH